MTSASTLIRSLLVYSICLPLAVFLGYMLATPLEVKTFAVLGFVLFFLALPFLLRWHHTLLILTWNVGAVLFFLPGRPPAWQVLAWVGFSIALLQYILNPRLRFIRVPALARPLILLAVVVLVTAKCSGGFGLGSLGNDTMGGRRYFNLLTAIIGYFALTSQRISPRYALLFVILFFLGSLTQAIGELARVATPGFYFLFLIFPVSTEGLAAIMNDPGGATGGGVTRLGGLSLAGLGLYCAMLVRYGIQQIFNLRRFGRLALFLLFFVLGMAGGFRSTLILMALTFAIVFYLEGLFRSRMFPLFLLLFLAGCVLLVPFSDRLPLTFQRALCFLPVRVDPLVKSSAQDSNEWRLEIWKRVLPEVPQYLLLGKGYSFTARDFATIRSTQGVGLETGAEAVELVGDYHNGPLSVIMPFGIAGTIAFLWFLAAALKAMYRNYKFGPPPYRRINAFLFAYFFAKAALFFVVFGSLHSDMALFTGLLGLSVSLNGGVAKPALAPRARAPLPAIRLRPVAPKPLPA